MSDWDGDLGLMDFEGICHSISIVRRDPKVLRRVSWILNKEGLHFYKPILYFRVEAHFNRSKID